MQTKTNLGLQFFAEPAEAEQPAAGGGNGTQPAQQTATEPEQNTRTQAVNVDINSIVAQAEQKATEAAERKMEAVFKSMLQQQGMDSDAINKMTAEWKSKQTTPEQTIAQLTKERDEEIAAKKAEIAEREKIIAALKQEKILRAHGLTDDEDIEIFGLRINKLVTAEKSFEQAAAEYFKAHPRTEKIPATAMVSGTGSTPMTGDKQKYKPPRIF